ERWWRVWGGCDGGRLDELGVGGEGWLPVRGLRERPAEVGDPQGAAGAARAEPGGGARDGPARARRNRPRPLRETLMDPYANQWLDLLVRWLHVVAAIAWIGSSFYFIALDNHLRPPKDEADAERGVGG